MINQGREGGRDESGKTGTILDIPWSGVISSLVSAQTPGAGSVRAATGGKGGYYSMHIHRSTECTEIHIDRACRLKYLYTPAL